MPDYFKYHGLGNDYLVLEAGRFAQPPAPEAVRLLCDRHRGIGADGVLWGDAGTAGEPGNGGTEPALRIFNPDGGEAEKSGNGLRIFARHLWECRKGGAAEFSIRTLGGKVKARVLDPQARRIAVAMGRVSFSSREIPVTGTEREVLKESLQVEGEMLTVSAATVGNPHCVVLVDRPTEELARRLGPVLEHHPWFPRRTNVQFMRVQDAHQIQIEIWERGAGYTQASGTSSCAAAAVACRLGLCSSPVAVHMPGGVLQVTLDAAYNVELEGEVEGVSHGEFAPEFLRRLGLRRLT